MHSQLQQIDGRKTASHIHQRRRASPDVFDAWITQVDSHGLPISACSFRSKSLYPVPNLCIANEAEETCERSHLIAFPFATGKSIDERRSEPSKTVRDECADKRQSFLIRGLQCD